MKFLCIYLLCMLVYNTCFGVSDTAEVTVHVLTALVEKGFEPNILTGVLGALHDNI